MSCRRKKNENKNCLANSGRRKENKCWESLPCHRKFRASFDKLPVLDTMSYGEIDGKIIVCWRNIRHVGRKNKKNG